MLTVDVLKGNSKDVNVSDAVKALPDAVIQELATLSKNDEDVVIGQKIKEVHEKYDKDVSDATGLTKNHNERSWDFLKRGIDDLKAKTADPAIKTRLEAAEAKATDLEKKIAEGKGNEVMVAQLEKANKDIADAKKEAKDWKDKHKADIEAKETELKNKDAENQRILVEAEFMKAESALKYKPEYSEEVVKSFVSDKKTAIMKDATVDFIDDGKGGKLMIFRDAKGEILRNKDNALNPFTASELLHSHLAPILDVQTPKPGGGSNPPAPKPGGGGSLRINAKTQTEATDQIREHLTAQGLQKGSEEWQTAQDKIWADSEVANLPLQ